MSVHSAESERLKGTARYTWGGDEFLFIEIDEAMSLAANFKANSMASSLSAQELPGISDVCPANASVLIRFDPDVLDPAELEDVARAVEAEVDAAEHHTFDTRIVEIPVWYDDPFTRETGERFRTGHQKPDGTDLDLPPGPMGWHPRRNSSAATMAAPGWCPWSASSPACRSCSRWFPGSSSSKSPST